MPLIFPVKNQFISILKQNSNIMKKTKLAIIFLLLIVLGGCRKSDFIIDESNIQLSDNGDGTGTVTWTGDKKYVLSGFVYVNDGQTLTIEPGTIIKFKEGQGTQASALIVASGGKIIANGTAEKPIIFTSELDDLNGNLTMADKGLWGGLIILGHAPLNNSSNEAKVEGIPISEPRGIYGGTYTNDNSGSLSYISIRHAGSILGQGNEINGLTLGGVGNGTEINHVEIVGCADDGTEIFGGTVDIKYLATAFCEDDNIDTDLGYQGRMQYVFAIQDTVSGDLLGEHGGGVNPILGLPISNPVIVNATYIGSGVKNANYLMAFRNNSAGAYYNSIFVNESHGITIEYTEGSPDSYSQFQTDDLIIEGNIFYNVATDTSSTIFGISGDYPGQTTLDEWHQYFYSAKNSVYDPGIDIYPTFIEPLPKNNVSQDLVNLTDPFFDKVNYKGAFGGINWLSGWSLLSSSGYIK